MTSIVTETATDLPPYSGGYFTCPKCGSKGASTTFMRGLRCHHIPGGDGYVVTGSITSETEWLHRSCSVCDYQVDEATIEQKPATQDASRR